MRCYQQLSYEERVQWATMQRASFSLSQMARHLERSKSTISRELRRNEAPTGQYWPNTAQQRTLERRKRGCVIDRHEELKDFIMNQLRCHYWTPKQIAGYLRYRQTLLPSVSHETIYAWIYSPALKAAKLWMYLPRHKAKRGLRKSLGSGGVRIPHRVPIHQRPKKVQTLKEFGHFEGDLMSFRRNSQHILVLRERQTMMTFSCVLPRKKAEHTAQAIVTLLKGLPAKARRTLTLDNGTEFTHHDQVAQTLGLKTFFCDPYASWQKGEIENTNGLLRRDLPRSTDLLSIQKEDFDETIDNLNSTPRKALGWMTPKEACALQLNRVALHS